MIKTDWGKKQADSCGSLQTIRWFRRSDLVVIPPFFQERIFVSHSFYKRISLKSGLTVMHNKKPSELFVLKVFVVAEWKGFEPLRGYKPT